MDILSYKGKEYVSVSTAASSLKMSKCSIYYYIKRMELATTSIDNFKLIELNSLLALNHLIASKHS